MKISEAKSIHTHTCIIAYSHELRYPRKLCIIIRTIIHRFVSTMRAVRTYTVLGYYSNVQVIIQYIHIMKAYKLNMNIQTDGHFTFKHKTRAAEPGGGAGGHVPPKFPTPKKCPFFLGEKCPFSK